MAAVSPIFASEPTAAKLLDMKPGEFRSLVERGLLPRGREIAPGMVRWAVDELRRIASGEAAEGTGTYEW